MDGHTKDVTAEAATAGYDSARIAVADGKIEAKAAGETTVTFSYTGEKGGAVTAQINVAVSNLDPFQRVEAETYHEASGDVQTEGCSDEGGGENVGYIDNGSWIMFKNVNFGSGAGKFEARTTSAGLGGNIELHLYSLNGPIIGTLDCPNNGSWTNWETKSCDVTNASGTHDLYLKFTGADGDYLFNINWWQFTEANPSETPTPAPTNAPTETPVST